MNKQGFSVNQESRKIKNFTDLNAWREAHKKEVFLELANQTITINKLLNGLIKKSKTMIHDS